MLNCMRVRSHFEYRSWTCKSHIVESSGSEAQDPTFGAQRSEFLRPSSSKPQKVSEIINKSPKNRENKKIENKHKHTKENNNTFKQKNFQKKLLRF